MVKKKDKVIAIILARMNSQRLPGKIMMSLGGQSLLGWITDRVKLANLIDEIWLATTTNPIDDVAAEEGEKNNILVYRGGEEDVLDRFYQVSLISKPEVLVRVTADNPFTSPKLINTAIAKIITEDCDYVTFKNIPLGSGVEVFKNNALNIAAQQAVSEADKEHVTRYIKNRPDLFSIAVIEAEGKLERPDIRLTVDTEEDYMLARAICYFLGKESIDLEKIIDLFEEQPWLLYINKHIVQKGF